MQKKGTGTIILNHWNDYGAFKFYERDLIKKALLFNHFDNVSNWHKWIGIKIEEADGEYKYFYEGFEKPFLILHKLNEIDKRTFSFDYTINNIRCKN